MTDEEPTTGIECPKCHGNPFRADLAERCDLCAGTGMVTAETRQRWLERPRTSTLPPKDTP